MRRILVDPEGLQSLASQFDEVAAGLMALGRRVEQSLVQTDWVSQALDRTEIQIHQTGRLGAELTVETIELGQGLRQTAERFLAANAWRPTRILASTSHGPEPAPTASVGPDSSATSPAPGSATMPTDPLAVLYARFPDPRRQAIMEHLVTVEGMGGPNAAHGGVLSQGEDGLSSDRQWLNFGYISFALPDGTGGHVLRQILASPEEAEAFRAIALRHLQDHPGGQVPTSHSHLLTVTGTEIPALSAAQQADQFVALVQAGDQQALGDWFFKYGNEPIYQGEIANGQLRADWKAVMEEFLARPASVQAQLDMIERQYLDPAIRSAERFDLHSTKTVAWFADQHVQSGGPTADMDLMLQPTAPPADDWRLPYWQRFQDGGEAERLQILTELAGSPGTTVRERREAVLANESLSWAPFPIAKKEEIT